MNAGIIIRELCLADCHPAMLAGFSRHQEMSRCWRKTSEGWALQDESYVMDWDENRKAEIAAGFACCIKQGGYVLGLYAGDRLAGFTSVEAELFGDGQYVNLGTCHVSEELRGKGLGKRLFREICEKARALGARKLYISAHFAEESVGFYLRRGCTPAQEINQALAEAEPCDRPLEFELYPY